MNREIDMQVGTMKSALEGAHIMLGERWVSDLMLAAKEPGCVSVESNHRVHSGVSQELPRVPLSGFVAWLVAS